MAALPCAASPAAGGGGGLFPRKRRARAEAAAPSALRSVEGRRSCGVVGAATSETAPVCKAVAAAALQACWLAESPVCKAPAEAPPLRSRSSSLVSASLKTPFFKNQHPSAIREAVYNLQSMLLNVKQTKKT